MPTTPLRMPISPGLAVLTRGSLRIALACLLFATPVPPAAARPLTITDVTIVDVENGWATPPRTVLIEAGRIAAIVAPADAGIPPSAVRIDGRGKYLIPGLVDMHVHLFNTHSKRPPNDWAFPLFIANGVTGVREMAADAASMSVVRQWRQAFDDGTLVAPRLLAVGIPVRGASPVAAARAVDAAIDAGADFVKVFSDVPPDEWRAIIAAARRRGVPVAGHVPAGISLLVAAEAGQRSAEHLMQAYEACSSIESTLIDERRGKDGDSPDAFGETQDVRALDAFDPSTCAGVGRSLARSSQAHVPTLVLAWKESIQPHAAPETDPRWPLLRRDEQARWRRLIAEMAASGDRAATSRWNRAGLIVSAFHRAGVTLLAGTDAPMPRVYPGYSLHEELELLVEAGLTPLDALRAATLAPARSLGIDALNGTVAAGKRADLVLLDADPLLDVRNTRRIHAVMVDGRLFRTVDLRALIDTSSRGGH